LVSPIDITFLVEILLLVEWPELGILDGFSRVGEVIKNHV
jgi:hypothetical protein